MSNLVLRRTKAIVCADGEQTVDYFDSKRPKVMHSADGAQAHSRLKTTNEACNRRHDREALGEEEIVLLWTAAGMGAPVRACSPQRSRWQNR
jgi:hypothetical protein